MRAIYEPAGRAREYAPLACNLYTGCTHGCLYCYAPGVMRRTKVDFHAKAEPRKGILEQLRKDVEKRAGYLEVLLCFTCDPYPANTDTMVTREALKILGEGGMQATVLTKGGERAERDFDLLAKYGFSFGTTLVFENPNCARIWEPGAAGSHERCIAIRRAHDHGIQTWVSLEPVIDPDETLNIISNLHPFVDYWKVGKWNHDKRAAAIDWPKFLIDVRALLDSIDAEYMIKADLAEYGG